MLVFTKDLMFYLKKIGNKQENRGSIFSIFRVIYCQSYSRHEEWSEVPPSNLGLPINLGLQGPLIQHFNILYDPQKQSEH